MKTALHCLLIFCFLAAAQARGEGFSGEEIQKFIDDAIKAGGGEVVLPPGRHWLRRPLVIKDAKNLRLVGLEAEETWLLPVADGAEAFPLLVVEGEVEKLRVAKITFTTRGSVVDFSGQPLVRVSGVGGDNEPRVEFDRCLFEHHQGLGLMFESVHGGRVAGCLFMDLGGAGVRAAGKTSGLVIEHNHLTRCEEPAVELGKETSGCRVIANETRGLSLAIAGEGHQLRDNEPGS